jgi:uncharacterized protein YbjQ (UPF0145 family)
MLITSKEDIPDHIIIEVLGIVKGNSVRFRKIGQDILPMIRSIHGGEIFEYTKVLSETSEQSIERMIFEAQKKGANGIIGFHISTSVIMKRTTEFLAYGTAVKLEKR